MRHLVALLLLGVLATPALGQTPPKPDEGMDQDQCLELARRIADNDDDADKAKALEELKKLGDDGIWDMIDAAKGADDDDFETLSDALVELGKDAIPELTKTLADDNDDVVALAISALGDMGKDALPALFEVVKKGIKDNQASRFRAAAILVDIGEDAIPGLVAIVKGGPKDARAIAASSLIELGEPSIKPLAGILDSHKDARECAEATLLKIGAKEKALGIAVFKAVLDFLKSKNAALRAVAVRLVGVYGDESAMKVVIDAICDDNDDIRKSGGECAALLGAIAVPDLVHCLGAADVRVAETASEALADIGEPAVAELERVLKAPIAQIRAQAVTALGNMKRKLSIEKVIPLLDDADSDVKDDAQQALENMTGEKLKTRSEWQAWWDKHKDEIAEEAKKAEEARKAEEQAKKAEGDRIEAEKKAEQEKREKEDQATPDPKKP
ncbi:MAG TPA: HEAT repeat domain-containing protein [Planctomycetota bacterium]|nr:HEAT repeat domain-containing protein [Planctomycetota bacterium]